MLVNKRLLKLTSGHRATLATLTVMLCLCTASYWLQAWFLAHALAGLVPGTGQGINERPLWVAGNLVAVLTCGAIRGALQQIQTRVACRLGTAVRLDLRGTLAAALLRPERLSDIAERGGARSLALSEGVDGVDSYVTAYIPHALQLQILCPVLLAVMAFLNPVLAAALLVAVAVAVGAPRIWGKVLARRSSTHWDTYEDLSADFLEALQGMRTLKILNAVPRFRARLKERSDALHHSTVSTMRVSLADTALADFGIQAGLLTAAALAVLGAFGTLTGLFGAETALVFFTLILASEIFRPVRDLARQWHAGYLGISALGSIDAAIESGNQVSSVAAPSPINSSADPQGDPNLLTLEDVSFRYSADSRWILHHANARISRGGITALSGPTGEGKSTLFDIVLGLLPATGACRLDGRTLGPADVSVVSQHSYLFPGTIRANLTAVNLSAGDLEMLNALTAAGLHQDLLSWPQGLDTVLSEGGGSISGGQLQRLAIARAILADRPVLLLDEPTSALNLELAAELMDSLRTLARRRIVLMTAHRPEALAAADLVLHLKDGALHETVPATSSEAP